MKKLIKITAAQGVSYTDRIGFSLLVDIETENVEVEESVMGNDVMNDSRVFILDGGENDIVYVGLERNPIIQLDDGDYIDTIYAYIDKEKIEQIKGTMQLSVL